MKKIVIGLTLLMCIIGLTGCNKNSTYTQINYNELQSKLENKESFVFVIGQSGCSACAMYKETMEEVIKDKKVEIFYLGLDTLNDEEYSKIYSKYVITGTPTTLFIKDGVETSTYDRLKGSADYSTVVENLKKHGFIGE